MPAVTTENKVIEVAVTGGRGPAGTNGTSYTPSYLVYTALLNQTFTSAPIATVLENTLGSIPPWIYISQGIFRCFLSNRFLNNKTALQIQPGHITVIPVISRIDNNYIEVRTNNTNNVLTNNFVEIRIYP